MLTMFVQHSQKEFSNVLEGVTLKNLFALPARVSKPLFCTDDAFQLVAYAIYNTLCALGVALAFTWS